MPVQRSRVIEVKFEEYPDLSGSIELRVDVYDAGRRESLGTLIWLHGGGHVKGAAIDDAVLLERISSQLNITVVGLDYRLAPENPFPAALFDCCRAVLWASGGTAIGIQQGSPLFIGGVSAGGNLAVATCLWLRNNSSVIPDLQVLVCPSLAGLGTENFMSGRLFREGYDNDFATRERFWDAYTGGGEGSHNDYTSPLFARDLRGMPPALIITAEKDPLRDEAEKYGRRLRDAGAHVSMRRQLQSKHSDFGGLKNLLVNDRDLSNYFISEIRKCLNPKV